MNVDRKRVSFISLVGSAALPALKIMLLAAFAQLLVVNSQAQKAFDGCPAIGNGKATKTNPDGALSVPKQDLNKKKNRDDPPTKITSSITLEQIMKPSNNEKFQETQGASIVGFVAHVKAGEPEETCNCARADIKDIHIEVVLKESDREKSSKYMVVEISPRWQEKLGDLKSVKAQLEGHWVRFTGWMLYDYIHKSNAKNTNPTGKAIWRATAWEIHPVTSFKVVPKP